jgi:hypothetical protein
MIAQTAVDLIDMGNLALQQGNVALARWQYEESLIIWRALDDAPGMAHALERLWTLEGNPPSTKWGGKEIDHDSTIRGTANAAAHGRDDRVTRRYQRSPGRGNGREPRYLLEYGRGDGWGWDQGELVCPLSWLRTKHRSHGQHLEERCDEA